MRCGRFGVVVSTASSLRDAIVVDYQESERDVFLSRDVFEQARRRGVEATVCAHESACAPLRAERWIDGCSTESTPLATISEVEWNDDAPSTSRLDREKTFLSREYHWSHMYKWVREWIRTCEVCHRVEQAPTSQTLLQSLPVPIDS